MISKKRQVVGSREKQQMCQLDIWPKLLSDTEIKLRTKPGRKRGPEEHSEHLQSSPMPYASQVQTVAGWTFGLSHTCTPGKTGQC